MEHVRDACGLSRGGLYHHFGHKRALLQALLDAEVQELARTCEAAPHPLIALLQSGSGHLGAVPGVLAAIERPEDRLDYLACLDQAVARYLSPTLGKALTGHVQQGVDPAHVAELFVTVNAQINRRQLLLHWDPEDAVAFAATALVALSSLLMQPETLQPVLQGLRTTGAAT